MSDAAIDTIRVAVALVFSAGVVACIRQAAMLAHAHNQGQSPRPLTDRWVYRFAALLSLLAAAALLTRL